MIRTFDSFEALPLFALGLFLAVLRFWYRGWTLTEQQKDGRLHYFIFDHVIFSWMPKKWRKFLRYGLTNPNLAEEKSDEPQTKL